MVVKRINSTEALFTEVEEAEAIRQANEEVREANEDEREANEITRVASENSRVSAEKARVTAESKRVSAENSRVTAENKRVAAESERVAAETSRATEWSTVLKPDVLAATENANDTAQTISEQAASGDFSATISSVTAVTGAAGTLAKVENVGTAQNAQLVITIPKGDTGAPFSISKTYSSIAEMEASYATDGLEIGDLVIIETGSVEDEDNAKVYMKSESEYVFLVDLSGSQGIKGETGQAAGFGIPTASIDANIGTPSVAVTATGDDTAKVFHFEFKNLKGEKGDTGEVSNTTPITFTQATTRTNIVSGEALNVLLGKISKYFADLSDVAFSGSYSDLSGAPTSLKNPNALTFTGGSTVSYDGSSAKSVAIPTSLKNPNALTFTGAVSATYDGSAAKTVNIPESGVTTATVTGSSSNFLQWNAGTDSQDDSLSKFNSLTINFVKVSGTNMAYMYGTFSYYSPGQDTRKIWRNTSDIFPTGFKPAISAYGEGYDYHSSAIISDTSYNGIVGINIRPAGTSMSYATVHFSCAGNIGDGTVNFCIPYITTTT